MRIPPTAEGGGRLWGTRAPFRGMDVEHRPSHAERARTLARDVGIGSLATRALDPKGFPYASLVAWALSGADPVLLLSELAEHTRNLRADPRAALLFAESAAPDALARARTTLLGVCEPVPDGARADAREAFLARHPDATAYEAFADFGFWRLRVESARYVGGFGRMSWIAGEAWARAEPDPIAPYAPEVLDHMNRDHADAVLAYCRGLAGVDATGATLTAVDRYGFEIAATTPSGPRDVRLAFSGPVSTPAEVRAELVRLAREARASQSPGAPGMPSST